MRSRQPGVKALILCNPSNPSGKVFTREELTIIADLAKKYDLYVITDEVYEHILYKPHEHVYMATLPGMRERTIRMQFLIQDLFHRRMADRICHCIT